eukprot:5776373-Amphidinium_carterae.1
MLLYNGRRAHDASTNRFCCWHVSYQAALIRANFPLTCKVSLLSCIAIELKRHPPQKRSKMKRLPCSSETQNMSVGCSAGVIHAGTCCGRAKWLPMSAMEGAVEFEATP